MSEPKDDCPAHDTRCKPGECAATLFSKPDGTPADVGPPIPAEVLERAERLGPADLRGTLLARLRGQAEAASKRYDEALERLANSPDSAGVFDKWLGDVEQAARHYQQIQQLVHWHERLEKQKAAAS